MKFRRFTLCLFALIVVCIVAMPALAEPQIANVTEVAGLLTDEQRETLENKAEAISQEYDMGIYIIALQDYTQYCYADNVEDAIIELFDDYDLGLGTDRAAASFFITMDTREFVFDFNSDRADYAFTEKGRDLMEDRVLPYLREDDWYGAFDEFLDVCREDLAAAQAGNPIGYGEASRNDIDPVVDGIVTVLFFLLPGLLFMGIAAVVLIVPMYSAGKKHHADEYMVPGSMRLTRKSDVFLRHSVSRRPKPKPESSSSGGSSHSYSSGSHSGRSGRF